MTDTVDGAEPSELRVFDPIGYVECAFDGDDESQSTPPATSRIILKPSFADGLDGLTPGQEIMVIFLFHRSTGYALRQHPKGDKTRAKRGVFSLCSPNRPNPIGITRVRITELRGNVISVTGLDAFNGTPLLDLKPVVTTSAPTDSPERD